MAPSRVLSTWVFLLGCLFASLPSTVLSDQANYYGDDGGGGNGDDAVAYADDDDGNVDDDDYIKYWTEYAILPKRCIV